VAVVEVGDVVRDVDVGVGVRFGVGLAQGLGVREEVEVLSSPDLVLHAA